MKHSSSTAREDGFTLVELLVVIMIIGILAAIAVPAYLNQRKEANEAALKSDLKNVAVAVQTYLLTNPKDDDIQPEEVAPLVGELSSGTDIAILGDWEDWCLVGINQGANSNTFDFPTKGMLYDSYRGRGLQESGTNIWDTHCINGGVEGDVDDDKDGDAASKSIRWHLDRR